MASLVLVARSADTSGVAIELLAYAQAEVDYLT